MREVVKILPQYDYLYYGDTANLPIGDKTKEEILALTKNGVEFLLEHDCQIVIIACNTASADSARALQDSILVGKYADRKILGVIVPTLEAVVQSGEYRLLLIGTTHTVRSGKYQIELDKLDPKRRVLTAIATPELVPLIEGSNYREAISCAIGYIEAAAGESEVVILGCTHYTEIKRELRSHFGERKKIISQDEVIPEKIKIYLDNHPELESKLTRGSGRHIKLTKHRPDYDVLLQHLLSGVSLGD